MTIQDGRRRDIQAPRMSNIALAPTADSFLALLDATGAEIPVARVQQNPIYPYEMRRAGITGEVNIGFIVDSNGDVRDAYTISSTRREFETAAVQAVSKWKFRPGRKSGRAVFTHMQVPIQFQLGADTP